MNTSQHSSDSFVFKTDRPWPNARLKVAAIVGHTSSSNARLWLRTGRLGQYSLLLYPFETVLHSNNSKKALKGKLGIVPLPLKELENTLQAHREVDFEVTDYEHDTTHVLDLENLDADTRYGYALYDRKQEAVMLGHVRFRSFRTPPPENEMKPFQFALFSCHMPYDVDGLFKKHTKVANLQMWDFLNETLQRHRTDVDLVIAGGDQCYSDGVPTLNIWKNLNRLMRKDGENLLPDLEAMRSWFRDIYRGYWGFDSVQRVFDGFPTYMTWDDHEIGDGWGSHRLHGDKNDVRKLLPDLDDRGLTEDQGRKLLQRMFQAAKQTYIEYQHCHNPPTEDEAFDYAIRRGGCEFYVLDGRGQRDIGRNEYRILGREQFNRFAEWAQGLNPEDTRFMFVVSAVPVLHTRASLVQRDELLEHAGLGDDLRDSWEHGLHNAERQALMDILFETASKGINVAILSGDVHISAVYSIEDSNGCRIYQLTSSAITYHLPKWQLSLLKLGAVDDGETEEGYKFERLSLYAENSYALISIDPKSDEAWFKLYGLQKLKTLDFDQYKTLPISNSLAKIRLF